MKMTMSWHTSRDAAESMAARFRATPHPATHATFEVRRRLVGLLFSVEKRWK